MVVRPGQTYVLLSVDPLPLSPYLRDVKKVAIGCEGVSGIVLDVPERISDFYHDAIKSLGLNASLALQVTPVGYPPKSWNGDGRN